MTEVEAHGQGLTSEFLDRLFLSIRDKVEPGKWVKISKNHEQVVAGLKHIIDMDVYGCDMDIVFNEEFTHFRKVVHESLEPHPFTNKYVTDHPPSYWTEQDRLKTEREKREYQRAMAELENETKPKTRKRVRRR